MSAHARAESPVGRAGVALGKGARVNVTIRLYAMGVALGARPAPAGEAEQPVGDPCTG